MNWLDRIVAYYDPVGGLKRLHARELLAAGAHQGARRGRTYEGWGPAGGDANEDVRWDLESLRDRARDLVRNTPHGENAVRMLTTQIIGTGIGPLIKGEGRAPVREAWARFCDECDFDGDTDYYGLQALAVQTMIESGEALIVRKRPPSALGLAVPLQLQVLEPDYIDTAKEQRETPDGGFVVAGVEFDRAGRRAAYWLFPRHPGSAAGRQASRRVPAADVIHLFRKNRPGAVRAAPWFAPVMVKAKDLADYDSAELYAKKLQACVSEFITTPEADPVVGERKTDPATGRTVEKMQRGQRVRLRPGEQVTLSTPPIVQGYADYSRKNVRELAAGLGLTYEALSGDLSTVNYSSFRAGHIYFNAHYERLRWHTVIPKACVGVWAWFEAAAAAVGAVPAESAHPGWVPPAYQSVDPLKDYKATVLAVRAALKSLRRAQAEQGEDPDELLDEIAESNEALDARGIVSDSDPRTTTAAGGPRTTTTTQGGDDDDTGTGDDAGRADDAGQPGAADD